MGLPKRSWVHDPHVWWRHPVLRILIAVAVLFLDMTLFFEDPVNDSEVKANVPGMGHLYSFLLVWSNSAAEGFLKVFLLMLALAVGMWFGRQVLHHRLLRDRLKLKMFQGFKGTFACMGLACIVTLLIAAVLYGLILGQALGTLGLMGGMTMRSFAQLTQCLSVSLDIIAIVMVVDAVLQDREHYGHWFPKMKGAWIEWWDGWFRVVVAWAVTIAVLLFTYISILGLDVGEDYNEYQIGGMSDIGRACVVTLVIFCDLFTVVQDWEFPSFEKPIQVDGRQILIAGMRTPTLRIELVAKLLRRLPSLPASLQGWCVPPPDWYVLNVTGAWLTYGPLFGVVLVDLLCARNQLFYNPSTYGQYTRGDGSEGGWRIWAIRDEEYLETAYSNGVLTNATLVTYTARWNETTGEFLGEGELDFQTQTLFYGSPWRYACAVPGLLLIPLFFFLVYSANGSKKDFESESNRFDSLVAEISEGRHDSEKRPEVDQANMGSRKLASGIGAC